MDSHSLERLDFLRIRELLASFAATGLGRELAQRIDAATSTDQVRCWHEQFREFCALLELRGAPPLAGITDVRETVRRCRPPLQVNVDEIAAIGDTLLGTHHVARYLADLPEGMPRLRRLAERSGDFLTVAQRIRAVIDERGQVRDDASPKITRLRRDVRRCVEQIQSTVERLLRESDTRRMLQYANHTFHNDRLVLPLKTEYRGRLPGIVHRSSDSGATIYVEPAQAVELNNEISNLRAEEHEEIARLLWALAHETHINADAILQTLDALAELDLIYAKARFARTYALRSPELLDEPLVRARAARHPLLLELAQRKQEAGQTPEPVTPIDYRIGDDFDMLVITGPNTGGKTVTLKTIGLLSLMAQAGLPVPVGEGSAFGVFERILIDIGDEQNMRQSLSTFSAHLKRQLDMLASAGPRTLTLMDELGAGTDPDEGAAIGTAILDELLRSRSRCVVTTHLGALKSFTLSRARAENGSVEFDHQTLRPTYHLRIGEAGMSNAILIARRLGMPARLLEAAERAIPKSARRVHRALRGAAAAKREAEDARKAAETAHADARRAQQAAQQTQRELEDKQAEFAAWASRVAHLKPGELVRVRGFDEQGRVLRVKLDQQRAEIAVGALTIEAPLGDLSPAEAPAPPPPPRHAPAGESRGTEARSAARKPGAGRAPRGADRPACKPGVSGAQPRQAPDRGAPEPRRPARPRLAALTDEQAGALRTGDEVYVKRFHRAGQIVRVNPERRVATVRMGVFGEVEAPFSGLSLSRPDARSRTDSGPDADGASRDP